MTAPKRICLLPDDGWSWVKGPKPPYEENAIEYVRADLAAVPAQVHPDPRDEVIARLVEAASVTLHDIDDLVANSSGVAGLHMNGDIADWETILDGGTFGAWLSSVENLRAALAAAKAVQHD